MDDEIKKLRGELARRERGRGKRYPAALKARIARAAAELRDRGLGWHRIGSVLGLPHETVRRYAGADGGGFLPVVVTATAPVNAAVLVTPSGFRVEGLGLAEIAELLGRLR